MPFYTWTEALRYVELHCCGKDAWENQTISSQGVFCEEPQKSDGSSQEPKKYKKGIQQPNKSTESIVRRVNLVAGSLHTWDWKRQSWVLRRQSWDDPAWFAYLRKKT